MKALWINILILIAGIGLLVGGIFVTMESTTIGIFMLVAGIILAFMAVSNLRAAIQEIKELITAESLSGEKTTRKQLTKFIVILASGCTVAALIVVAACGFYKGMNMNSRAYRILEMDGDGKTLSRIAEFEEQYQNEWLGKLFFTYGDEFAAIKEETHAKIRNRAREISDAIAQLELPDRIQSKEHYITLHDSAYRLKLSYDEENANQIEELIVDYGKIDVYLEELEVLRQNYAIICNACKGNGGFTCTTCHGSDRLTCDSCNGRGKKLVTWYSEGNWGDTSYSSYECTSCHGSGKKSCSDCNGGENDCRDCDGGYIYIYEDERKENNG